MPPSPLSRFARVALRGAIIGVWLVSVGGIALSCRTLQFYRSPIPAATRPTPSGTAALTSASSSARPSVSGVASASVQPTTAAPSVRAIAPTSDTGRRRPQISQDDVVRLFERHRSTRLPLCIANLLLSLAVVVGAARTLGRKPGATSWLRQACYATAIFAVAEWYVTRSFRHDFGEIAGAADAGQLRAGIEFVFAAGAILQLVLHGGLATALGRDSVLRDLARTAGRDDES